MRERNCPTTNCTRAPSIAAKYQEEEAPGAGSARFQKVARTGELFGYLYRRPITWIVPQVPIASPV
jgi:hypothetical protein